MENPLLKKRSNGFETPAGTPKKHYKGFYPEAIGGGWNPSDGDDLSHEYSKDLGGYLKRDAPNKVQGYIEDVYKAGQEPVPQSEGKKSQTVKSVRSGLRWGRGGVRSPSREIEKKEMQKKRSMAVQAL